MNLPKISIITPTYNAAATIEKVILSVANQSYENIEHLFIDGLSTDNTLSIIKKYQQKFKHIKLFTEKDNGIYDAMNKGIILSKGDWLYFLGADDELFNANIFTELYNEEYLFKPNILYGNVYINGDIPWAKDKMIYDGPFDLSKLLKKNICHQAILYPAFVIRKIGFYNEKYYITADWEYNIRCYSQFEFVYIDKVIAIFNSGGKSSIGEMDDLMIDLPELLLRYFNLNPRDKSIYSNQSPFSSVMAGYQKKMSFLKTTTNFISSIFCQLK